jgi:DNA recombination protein RmuC
METILILLLVTAIVLLALVLASFRSLSAQLRAAEQEDARRQGEQQRLLLETVTANLQQSQESQKNAITQLSNETARILEIYRQSMESGNRQTALGLRQIQESQEARLDRLEKTVDQRLEKLSQLMDSRLAVMQATVDEKLHKTLEERIGQSFQLVSQRLEQVYKGLGEMQALAAGVGDLKKVLANVKTRGVLGEYQLGAILEQILSPEQYAVNVATKKGCRETVEYALRLPGPGEDTVWLPIDAKFPADSYNQLLEAYDKGDAQETASAAQALEQRIRRFAKDIRDKYLDPPFTTDFAILFLPFEGLYAEVVRRGMVESLGRDYRVNIAGPTTLAALLNSLQMGFKTLAIQKRSGEVWQVLGAVKTEFDKFGMVLESTQQRLDQANKELDQLIGVRTRQIRRRLKDVAALPESETYNLLEQEDSAYALDLPEE